MLEVEWNLIFCSDLQNATDEGFQGHPQLSGVYIFHLEVLELFVSVNK